LYLVLQVVKVTVVASLSSQIRLKKTATMILQI